MQRGKMLRSVDIQNLEKKSQDFLKFMMAKKNSRLTPAILSLPTEGHEETFQEM
jgi:hypothetical protein